MGVRFTSEYAPLAISAIKSLVKEGLSRSLHEGLEVELEQSIAMFQTEEPFEGITAYLEKRLPDFKGR
jgi:enoyl-CoA hydratase/carnithine racemase